MTGRIHVRKARHGSTCVLCRAPITVGQQISDGTGGSWAHVACLILERNKSMSENRVYSYGEVGHDPPVHAVLGPWQGPLSVSRREAQNVSLCGRHLSRARRNSPDPHDLCRKCEELMASDGITAPELPLAGPQQPLTELQDYQVQMVRLGDLFVDREGRGLQRQEQASWSKKIAAGFDWAMFNENPPKVSARPDGRYHIMDGQHEIAAARLAGYGPDTKVRVHVWHGLTRQQEAEKFSHNRLRHSVKALDMFNSDVARGQPDAIALDALLTEYGWTPGSSGRHGNFAAVTTLRAASIDVARKIVETITTAWGMDPLGPNRLIVAALRGFYVKYPDAKTERMAAVLQRTTPIDVQNQARGDRREVVVHRLQVMYDSGLRQGRLEQPS